jgi:predicted signal transduction protein with EAL and GGDEF domain
LTEVARVLSSCIREEDMLARIGGEEFIVSSPYLNRLAAIVLAERLRKAMEGAEIFFEGNRIPVTMSLGIAVRPQDGDELDHLIAVADERLYVAKQTGRNRFCASDKNQRDDREVDVDMVCPKLDEALAMIRHGNLHRLMPHLPKLLEELMPLFELVNEETPAQLDVEQLRSAVAQLKD